MKHMYSEVQLTKMLTHKTLNNTNTDDKEYLITQTTQNHDLHTNNRILDNTNVDNIKYGTTQILPTQNCAQGKH